MYEQRVKVNSYEGFHALFGEMDQHIMIIEAMLKVNISTKDGYILIDGKESAVRTAAIAIQNIMKDFTELDRQKIEYMVELAQTNTSPTFTKEYILSNHRGKPIKPKTLGQNRYVKAISSYELVFGIGPAGTGKTFLSVAMAAKALKAGKVERIVVTRPAIEAGENLGFLPGDLEMKVDPYLRPIFDAMIAIFGYDHFMTYREKGVIEIAPLAYMRGRSLEDSFIILDEAQNTTDAQMKMFLTRFGARSHVVVNGDVSQIDLPRGQKSGLITASKVLKSLDDVAFIYFTEQDVVRHSLVKKIIACYHSYENTVSGNLQKDNNNQMKKK